MAIGLQLILLLFAVVGAVAAVTMLKSPAWRRGVFSFFILLAVAASVLIFVTYQKPLNPEDVARQMAGGDNFCFFEPFITQPKNLSDPVPIKIVNKGFGSIPRVEFLISPYWIHGDAANHGRIYYSIMQSSQWISCDVGGRFVNVITPKGPDFLKLEPGRYRIEFTTSINTGWVQVLTIEQSFDRLVSTVDVFQKQNGKLKNIYHSTRPLNYVEWGALP